jgi:hypothetical protein
MKLGKAMSLILAGDDISPADSRAAVLAVDFLRWVMMHKLMVLTNDVLDGDGGKKLFALAARKWINIAKGAATFELGTKAPPEIQDAWNEYMTVMDEQHGTGNVFDIIKDMVPDLVCGDICESCSKRSECDMSADEDDEDDEDDDEEDWQ